jgi:hypothetical protein
MVWTRIVGGALRGEEFNIREDVKITQLYKHNYEPVAAYNPHEMPQATVMIEPHVYRKMNLSAGHLHTSVFVPSDWRDENALAELIAGYLRKD